MMPIVTIGGVSIPTFFIVISLTLSFLVIYLSLRIDQKQIQPGPCYDLALVLMVSGFIGGRLMHVFFEEWPYYQRYPWHVLYVWQGGYVFYGGFILGALSTWLYCRIKKIHFLEMADFFAPLLSLAHAFGRVGCFLSGCCYGSACLLPWAIDGRHPTTLYLFSGELLIYAYLLFFESQMIRLKERLGNRVNLSGAVFMKWVLLHSLLRFFVENYRADFRGTFFYLPALGNLSVSQLISLGLIVISTAYFANRSFELRKSKS